jgi:hypothetical protein
MRVGAGPNQRLQRLFERAAIGFEWAELVLEHAELVVEVESVHSNASCSPPRTPATALFLAFGLARTSNVTAPFLERPSFSSCAGALIPPNYLPCSTGAASFARGKRHLLIM